MKRTLSAASAVAALGWLAATALAGGPGCPCACGPAPCCGQPVLLRAEVAERKYTVPVVVRPGYTSVVKTEDREVAGTRLVPVCVEDPCTHCKRTEMRPEAVVEKVKVTVIQVVPPKEGCTTRPEERTQRCIKIYLDAAPACVGEVPPPPPPAPPARGR